MRRNFSLVARHWLESNHCSLLVAKSARYSLQKLLVAKKSLIPRCKIRSLLVAEVARCKKITHFSLQNWLVTRCRSCSLQKITHYSLRNSLATCCKKSLVTRCKQSFDNR